MNRARVITTFESNANEVPRADGEGGYTWGPDGGGGAGVVSVTAADDTLAIETDDEGNVTAKVAPGTYDDAGAASSAQTAAEDYALEQASQAQSNAEEASLPRAGGTMSGSIAMGSNKITDVADGTASSDAAAFGQIATAISTAIDATKYAETIGDGSTASYTVTHDLDTTDVLAQAVDLSTNQVVYPTITITDPNNLTVGFSVAPASDSIRVIIHA